MIDVSATSDDINSMFKKGVVTHFMPSGKDYMRTIGSLPPSYLKQRNGSGDSETNAAASQ